MIKTILIVVFLFLNGLTFAQELINNFKQDENGLIYWQNIVESQLDPSKIEALIAESGYFDILERLPSSITCKLKPYSVNYIGLGYDRMKTLTYIKEYTVEANIVFEFKEGKYRVVISHILFTKIAPSAGLPQGSVRPFEKIVLDKDQKIKESTFNYGSSILQYSVNF
ncbi:MAG: hypothetical protein AB9834_09940 [Lentimicrobium sp.]